MTEHPAGGGYWDSAAAEAATPVVGGRGSRDWHPFDDYGLSEGFDPDVLRDSVVDACGYLDCLYGILVRRHENAIEVRGRLTDDASERRQR